MDHEEQWEKLSFWQGFFWARDLVQALGYEIPRDVEVPFVRSLAEGEISLEPSPAEFVRKWEEKNGCRMNEMLRQMTYQFKQGGERRRVDVMNQKIARHYLAVLDPSWEP